MDRPHPTSPGFAQILAMLIQRQELTDAQMACALEDMAAGRYSDAQVAAWLVALRMKGETAREIASATRVVRKNMVRFESGCTGVLDTCGTGGSGPRTFNISTATALVAAGAGVPVVKHGNRAV